MILVINTTDNEKIAIALVKNDGNLISEKIFSAKFQHSEKLLPAIESLLKKNTVKLGSLKGIIVASGPGGFTALRVGIITANTLGFALEIPVVGVRLNKFIGLKELIKFGLKKLGKAKLGTIILPYYGREPHITKPKKNLFN